MNGETVRQAAERMYPGLTYDTSVPQSWFDDVMDATDESPFCQVVWLYPENSTFGFPAAVTAKGSEILYRWAMNKGPTFSQQ